MATPMYVFAEIASRFGVNPTDEKAVDDFFMNENSTLSADEQIAIMEELICRDGEKHESTDRIS